jgi:hypothetical protein
MPAEYCQHGLRILYPENWQLAEFDNDDESVTDLSLESPDGSMLMIQASPLAASPSAAGLLDEMTSGLQTQYDDVELAECSRPIGKLAVTGREALFFCLDSLVQARLLVFDTASHRVAALYQADSRRMPATEQVFEAILAGMLMGKELPAKSV